MRQSIVTFVLLLAGCSAPDSPATDEPEDIAMAEPMPPLPEDIWTNGTLGPSVDFVSTGGPVCAPPTSQCQRFAATLPREGTITAVVRWTLVADDVDLYLMSGGEVVEQSNGFESRHEFFRTSLPAGDYEVVVSGSLTGGTPFELFVWFDEP